MSEESKANETSQLERFVMWIANLFHKHNYYVVQEFSHYSRRIGCTGCIKTWAMNDDCQSLLEWDADFENMYKVMGHYIVKPW